MAYRLSPLARILAGVITAVALGALVVQFIAVRAEYGYSVPHSIWVMARYLSILTTGLVAVTFGAIATGLAQVGPRWLGALTLAFLLVAAGFHALLRGVNPVDGLEVWSDLGFHTVGPALVALYWLAFAPRGVLSLFDVPLFLSWPALYVSYALTRGGLDGIFPYPFLDPSAIGWQPVLWTIGIFAVGITAAALAMVILDRVIARFVT